MAMSGKVYQRRGAGDTDGYAVSRPSWMLRPQAWVAGEVGTTERKVATDPQQCGYL